MRYLPLCALALVTLAPAANAQERDRVIAERDYHHYAAGDRLEHRWGNYGEVRDWRDRGLAEPGDGYRWYRHGDDYVQAAIASGIIASVAAGAAANSAYPPTYYSGPYPY